MKRSLELNIHPLTPSRWSDLELLFAAKGCSFARSCWCMDYRIGRSPHTPDGISTADFKRERLRELTAQVLPPGLIAYHEDEPVGWITVGPREDFGALARDGARRYDAGVVGRMFRGAQRLASPRCSRRTAAWRGRARRTPWRALAGSLSDRQTRSVSR